MPSVIIDPARVSTHSIIYPPPTQLVDPISFVLTPSLLTARELALVRFELEIQLASQLQVRNLTRMGSIEYCSYNLSDKPIKH